MATRSLHRKAAPKAEESFGAVLPRRFFVSRHRDRFGLTEDEIDQMRAKTLRVLLQMMLTTQLSAALSHKGSAKKNDRSERVKGKITLPAGKTDEQKSFGIPTPDVSCFDKNASKCGRLS